MAVVCNLFLSQFWIVEIKKCWAFRRRKMFIPTIQRPECPFISSGSQAWLEHNCTIFFCCLDGDIKMINTEVPKSKWQRSFGWGTNYDFPQYSDGNQYVFFKTGHPIFSVEMKLSIKSKSKKLYCRNILNGNSGQMSFGRQNGWYPSLSLWWLTLTPGTKSPSCLIL